ncbi:MAG: hypothetical protein QOG20_6264 [Pseudonocardiales bacterium]|jgi:hypothetical protein|nr:hypothetical protein [Pseudonocardiales bacterium]
MSTSAVLQIRVGVVNVDVPRLIGYYGGAALAVSLGLIDPPLGVFIAAVPLLKLLTHRGLPLTAQFVGELMEGASKPVGGDTEAVFHIDDEEKGDDEAIKISRLAEHGRRLAEARQSDADDPVARNSSRAHGSSEWG